MSEEWSWERLKAKAVKVAAATGHRPHKLNKEYDGDGPCTNHLRKELERILVEESIGLVISGFALGFDQIIVEECFKLDIPVFAAIPCDGQEKIWPWKSQDKYHRLLSNPLIHYTYVVSPGPYEKWKMYSRNRYMVDNADVVISAWDGTRGGTYDAVKYARSIEKPVINIDPNGWQSKPTRLTLF